MARPEMILWLSDSRGIYLPRDFAKSFADRARCVRDVKDEDWAILEAGPDHEQYWDAWLEVSEKAVITDNNGVKYTVWQCNDCWLVPIGMRWDDEADTYVWPEEETEASD